MSCLDENTVAAFLGGSLAAEGLAQAQRHVEECSGCRQLVAAVVRGDRGQSDGLSNADTLVTEAPRETVPAKGSLVNRYVVLDPIGAGGMGAVYSAYDPVLERKVALKLVRTAGGSGPHDEVKARLLREGKSIAQLSHPNVVVVHDMGTFQGEVFVAMELVDGGTLRQWMREKKRGWREVLEKLLAAGEGLAAAHRARLVHRDFKPENVLLGKDGRIRVTDFGLVRSFEVASGSGSPTSEPPHSSPVPAERGEPVTRAGAVVGTLAYMSPEQHAGRSADALSDQFSFCVALWEALFGARPYRSPGATADWRLVEPPKEAGVPPWVTRPLLRGLSCAPEARYQTMEELLAALAADPGRARKRRLLQAAGAIALAALAGSAYRMATSGGSLCKGAPEQVEAAWSPVLKESIRVAFAATGSADADPAWHLAQRGLDRHWQSWAAMRTEACEATRVRGEQSDQLLGLRMACLDRRRTEAKALMELLSHADLEVVAKAPEAVNALTSLHSCADVEALLAQVPPPEEPAVRAKLEQVRAQLDEGKARFGAGKYQEALDRAAKAVAEARALAHRPAIAEALLLLGRLEEHLGELHRAEQTLLEAIATAEAGRHDEVTAQAATHLVLVLGARQARYAEARAWGKLAEGAISRIGGSEELQARLLRSRGLVLYAEGQLPESIEHHRRALALRERLEPDSLNHAESLNDLGAALRSDGKPKEALVAFEGALGILVKRLGPESDLVAITRNGMGNVHMLEGRFDRALADYRQSLKTYEKTLGATHFRTVTTLNNIGVVFAEQSRFADALPYFHRVLEARERTLAQTDSKVADAHSNLGMLLVELGRLKEAQAQFEQAKGILQGYPLDHFSQAEVLLGFAKIHLAAGTSLKALAPLERVLKLSENREGLRFEYAGARASFLLGRALWASARDTQRARLLAARARDALEGFGRARFKRDLAEIEGWLAAHPGPG